MHVGYCKVYRSCFRTFGAKVLGIFVLMIRQLHRNESSWNVRQDYTIGTPPKCNLDCCNVCKNVTIFVIGG